MTTLEEILGKLRSKKIGLYALSPLDGRYSGIADELRDYFSEYALIKYRVKVEIAWLEFLLTKVDCKELKKRRKLFFKNIDYIMNISDFFSLEDALKVKKIEEKTKHDVKAVEYFIAKKLKKAHLNELISLVHIGCTSEDINNLAYALMIKDAREYVYEPALKKLIKTIDSLVDEYQNVSMLAHTHGQPATPTILGKEFKVYSYRLSEKLNSLDCYDIGKFNGATGNYSAISIAFPNEDWIELSKDFVKSLGLSFNPFTTQIESHDKLCELLAEIKHINMIIRNLDIDMWTYISKQYFKQSVVNGEVGSSTMPHKVNPIKFENSEGNTYISNGLIDGITSKLLTSRMQRDLSDSTVQRNIGMAIGYALQAIEETTNGLMKCSANVDKLAEDLDSNWEVLAEPIQTILRKYGISDAYDQLKALTRGNKISKEDIYTFVNSLKDVSEEDKQTLLNLSPSTYIGLAQEIATTKS